MLRLKSGGMINEEHVTAVLQRGANWVAMFSSGTELVIDPEDAAAIIGDALPPPKK